MTTCRTCTHWSPKTAGEMARHRFGTCTHDKPWVFYPPARTCASHCPADAATVYARDKWLAKGPA